MLKKLFHSAILIFGLIIFACFIHACFFSTRIDTQPAKAQTSSDAIAVRVKDNPNHYSARRWYYEQEFEGSPQSLTVDGYEAVRDGRTVYINAANVDATDLYTFIYVISYNQEAEESTTDIFGQILKHWKFNTNLTAPDKCRQATTTACLIDDDCPSKDHCLSAKAEVTRDTRRMADMVDIETALIDYYSNNNIYPKLESGSYLAYQTLSVWPSWNATLGKTLGATPPQDPINELGSCPGFDPVTCWDENAKIFDGSIPNNLPANSNVYIYSADSDGLNYELCTLMESTYGQNSSPYNCGGTPSTNNPPTITLNLPGGTSGQPYLGTVSATTDPGETLTFTINTGPGAPWTLWSEPPYLNNTGPTTRDIAAAAAGAAGTYNLTIIVDDGKQNGRAMQSGTITVNNPNLPSVTVSDQTVLVGSNLDVTFIGSDGDSHYPLSFGVSGLPQGLSHTVVNQTDLRIGGQVVDKRGTYTVTATPVDSYQGHGSPATFTITVNNSPPNITSSAPTRATTSFNYTYQVIATDPDGHAITKYTAIGLPGGLNINQSTGLLSGLPDTAGSYPITITVEDQYGEPATQTYTLNVIDELFSLSPIPNGTVYLCDPLACPPVFNMYHPVTFFTTVNTNSPSPVTFSMTGNPSFLLINSSSGQIQGTPMRQSDLGTYAGITVTATTLAGVSRSTTFTLTVLPNEWCGDTNIQSAYGENCDSAQTPPTPAQSSPTNQYECDAACHMTGGYCGDGYPQTAYGEICDDGNSDNGDGCLDTCSVTTCGDGQQQSPNGTGTGGPNNNGYEDCDDGNMSNADVCDNNCTFTFCSDGIKQTPNGDGSGANNGMEECDGTDYGSMDNCTDYGFDGGTLNCNLDCSVNTSACTYTTCGDGVRQQPNNTGTGGPLNNGYEDCDMTDIGPETCQTRGYNSGTLLCDTNCVYDESSCVHTYCGDLVRQNPNTLGNGGTTGNGDEECDGNDLGGVTCVSLGFGGGLPTCTANCTIDSSTCCCAFGNSSFGSCTFCP